MRERFVGLGPWEVFHQGIANRTGLALGSFLPGGTIGLGTILFAFGIGPVVQFFLRYFDPEGRVGRRRRPVHSRQTMRIRTRASTATAAKRTVR